MERGEKRCDEKRCDEIEIENKGGYSVMISSQKNRNNDASNQAKRCNANATE